MTGPAAPTTLKARLDGFVNVNKPRGCTSMDVVRRLKRLSGMRRRVGHGGTLDPLAEGVLPICFGQATRLMETLVNSPKGYTMKAHLGVSTTTYDSEGEVLEKREVGTLTSADLDASLDPFRGVIYQTPPMYSALKHKGKRLYELARAGVEVEREPRRVEIFQLELTDYTPPTATLRVECGRGVYMRSLAHHWGQELGCGAHLSELIRVRSGPFRVEDAVTLDDLEAADSSNSVTTHLRPVDCVLLELKSTTIGKAAERLIRTGQSVTLGPELSYAGYLEKLRAYTTDGRFLGVLRFYKTENQWKPYQVFNLDTPSPYAPVELGPQSG